MKNPRLSYLATVTFLLPGVVIGISLLRSGDVSIYLFLGNWAIIVLPQALVAILAVVFPQLRNKFAPRAFVLLTALFLLFSYVTSLDANGAMLWVFYFGLSVLLVIVLFALPPYEKTRGL